MNAAIDIGIKEKNRKEIAAGLLRLLADTYKVNDEPSADLLTQRMQVHEKHAWMLSAGKPA